MKSIMKSAFAIIAVALMIMVAVVPMVGVFIEDSSATVTDPDQASTDKIKLTFNLYNTDGTAVSDSNLFVKITWNSGKNVQYVAKGTQVAFDETKMTGAKAVVGTGNTAAAFVQDTTFPEYVIGDVAAGTTLIVDIYKGTKATGNITFNDAGNTSIYTTLTGVFGASITAKVTYDLYDKADATQPIESNKTATLGSAGFVAYYPATYADVFVKVTKITVTLADASTKDIAFSNATAYRIVDTGAGTALKADQTILTITNVAKIPQGVVSNVVGTGATSVTEIDGKISATKSAYFMYTMASGTTSVTDFKYTLTFGSVVFEQITTSELSTKAFYGTYAISSSNAVSAQDGASLSFVVKDSEGTIVAGTEKTAYVAGGYYIAQAPTKEDGQLYAAISTDVKISTSISTTGNVDLTAATEGTPEGGVSPQAYKMVYVSGTVINAPAGYTFTVSGATKTFGLTDNKIVCGGSNYSATFGFYMVGDTYIEFKATDGSAFSDATTTKYFIGSTTAKNVALTLEQKVMKFKFTDGDAKAVSSVTVGVYDTVAKKVLTLNTDYTADTSKATVTLKDGSIDLSKLNVWFTASKDTFVAGSQATAVAYVAGTDGKMAVSSLETTYYVFVKDANGNIISATLKYAKTTAYVAEDGTKVYAADASTDITSQAADGSYSIRVNKNLVNVTLTGEPQNVLIFKASQTGYIFDTKPCLATADTNNTMVITAKADGFTATIYKTDGVTPIVNTEFKLVDSSSSNIIDVAVTDKDGKISFTSNATIADNSKIVPTVATGLGDIKNTATLPSTNVASSHVFYSKFLASKNIFTVSIADADGVAFSPGSTGTFEMTGGSDITVGKKAITVSSTAKAGDILTITLKNDTNAVRTFDKYTLTADDIKNGTISLVSNESTYSVSAVDADGKTIYINGSTVVQKKVANTYTTLTASADFVYLWTEYKVGSNITGYDFVLTAPGNNEVYYALPVAVDNTYALTQTAFDEKNVAVAESTKSTITFELVDATGASIEDIISEYYNNVTATGVTIKNIDGTNKYYFIGDAAKTYKVTVAHTEDEDDEVPDYSFAAQNIKDGVVKAKEQPVTFVAIDAAGKAIDAIGFTINTIATDGKVEEKFTNVSFDANGEYLKVMAVDSTLTYQLVDSDEVYNFTTSGTKFTAAEQTVEFTFSYANGVYHKLGTVTGVVLIDKSGYRTTLATAAIGDYEIIADLTDVASYEVTVTYSGSTTTTETFYGTSSDLRCVDSYIQGFAAIGSGYTVTATGYKGTTPIGTTEDIAYSTTTGIYSITANIPEGYSILVQCYNASGVLYAQATLDSKTTMICDLVSVTPIAETLKAKVLDYGADYVKLAFANGKVYLTADDKYTVETVDGLYVQTYKFAGWYVNGVKLTDDLNCAVDNVDTNVVSANYVLDDSKELGKESASGISPTVLVIGIAAVIIALIAVVYAVIQKKE